MKLTVEPVVAKGLCLSTPVFTLDRNPGRAEQRGAFTVHSDLRRQQVRHDLGRFVSPTEEVEGFVVYHFDAQDLCAAGR